MLTQSHPARGPDSLLLCLLLSHSCISSQQSPILCCQGHGTPAEPEAPRALAGNSCWCYLVFLLVLSATPASQAQAAAQTVCTRLAALSSHCPGAPEEGEQNRADLGKLHFFLQRALLSLLWQSQAAAWCSQLGRQHPCAFVTSLFCTGKALGHVPKYPSALWKVVGLETSKCSESLIVWGLPSTSVCSRNRML